ncbi:beta-lactamase/transpeptidase-like protein [Sarocladium strictum]
MPPTSLKEQSVKDIEALIEEASIDRFAGLPCAGAVIVGDGRKVTEALVEVIDESADVYWLASCTKLVTSIACLQLVDKGVLELDNADQVERLCPELRDVKIATRDGRLVEKLTRITLRSLLTHTSGFGYSFLSPSLEAHQSTIGKPQFDEFSGFEHDLHQPLVNQPGMDFQYGISHDWAGILIQRATGEHLNDYMQKNIFQPLDVKSMTMFPDNDLQSRLAGMWQRGPDGQLSPRQYPLSRALDATLIGETFNSGGAGLYGTLRDFSQILIALLNNGLSPSTRQRILEPEAVKALFTNQIPEQPDFARVPQPASKPDLVYATDELYPLCPSGKPQGWGLGTMISPSFTGRSDSTAHWCGLSNVFWWCDMDKGVAGIVGTQVLPFIDPKAAELWATVESKVYEGLEAK